jgi:hypothetical protein
VVVIGGAPGKHGPYSAQIPRSLLRSKFIKLMQTLPDGQSALFLQEDKVSMSEEHTPRPVGPSLWPAQQEQPSLQPVQLDGLHV